MNKKRIMAIALSAVFVLCTFSACGDSKTPGSKNDKLIEKTPESVGLIDDDVKSDGVDVTAITAATDPNGKVTDSKGITDKLGHVIYSTGQKDSSGQTIYTTGKKDSNGNILYTKDVMDSFGNLIYYTGKYDESGKLTLTPSTEAPDYTTNETPKDNQSNINKVTTSVTVGYNPTSKEIISDATCKYTKYFGGKATDTFTDVASCTDGGYVAIGQTQSTDGDLKGIDSAWSGEMSAIVKYDADGKISWKYVAGADNSISLTKVAVLKDQSVVAVGSTEATEGDAILNSATVSAAIVRVNKNGELMWMYSFPGDKNSQGEYISSVAATPDGGFVVGGKAISKAGFFTGTSEKGSKAFIFKFDKNCNIKWRKILSGSMSNCIEALAVTKNGDIYASCVTASSDNDFSAITPSHSKFTNTVLMKLDKNGDLDWAKYLESTGNSELDALIATSDGGCVIGGSYDVYKKAGGAYTQTFGGRDGFIIRYSPKGEVNWSRIIGGEGNEYVHAIAEVDGGFVVTGRTNSKTGDFQGQKMGGNYDGFVMLVSPKGQKSNVIILNGSQDEAVMGAVALTDGTAVVCGWTQSNDNAFEGSGTNKQYKAFVSKYEFEKSEA